MSRLPATACRTARRLLHRPKHGVTCYLPPQISCLSSTHHAPSSQPSLTSEIERMRAFQVAESSRNALTDAEDVLLWWAYQRTPESVTKSLDILDEMARHVSDDIHGVLQRKLVNAVVLNWQAVYKDGGESLSPHKMLHRLDKIAKDCPSLALSGKACSVIIDVCVVAYEPLLAEQILRRMLDDASFTPSTHTLNTVLQGYRNVDKPLKVRQLIQQFRAEELSLDINSYNILLACLANNKQSDLAEEYLENLCRGVYKVSPTLSTFHAVLHGLANSGEPERAEAILARLYDPYDWGALGVRPDTKTLNLVLSAWAQSGSPQAGERAWVCFQEQQAWAAAGMPNVAPDVVSYGTVIHALCMSGRVEKAEEVVQNMYQQFITHADDGQNSSSKLVPNVVMLTPILEGWSKSEVPDRLQRAEQFFVFLKDWAKYILKTSLDLTVYNVMMDVYGKCAATDDELRRADNLLQEIKASFDLHPNFTTYSILIQLVLRQQNVEHAKNLMDELQLRYEHGDDACQPDKRSMNQIIRCFCRAGAPDVATELLMKLCEAVSDRQQKTAVEPEVATFGSVVAAFARSSSDTAAEQAEGVYLMQRNLHKRGLLKEGPDYLLQRARLACWTNSKKKNACQHALRILHLMKKKFTPDTGDYNEVLKALVRQWRVREAQDLLIEMITGGKVEPNLTSFNLVVLAWSRVNSAESINRIEDLFHRMEKLSYEQGWDVKPDSSSYNNMLQCLVGNSKIAEGAERAEALLQSMVASDQTSYLSFIIVMGGWIKRKNLDRAEKVLQMLYAECKKGQLVAQRKHFQELAAAFIAAGMPDRGETVMEMWQELKRHRVNAS